MIMAPDQGGSFGGRLEMIQASYDPRERIRLINEELEGYDDEGTAETDPPPTTPIPRWKTLIQSETVSAEWVLLLVNMFWGVSLLINSKLFESTPTLYAGDAKLADEWFWGLFLVIGSIFHFSGYMGRIIQLRLLGVAIWTSIWTVAAFAQLGSDTFSPTPFAFSVALLWLFMRLPAREA